MRASLQLELPCTVYSPGLARQAIRGVSALMTRREVEDLELLVSELLANSVRHSGAGPEEVIHLDLEIAGDRIRARVADGGPGLLVAKRGDRQGFGLHIIERIATRWGTSKDGRSQVWFDLRRGD